MAEATKRYAVVTGANKGIGYETVRQLASNGIIVVLTARDEKRGLEAVEKLKHSGFDSVIFHQLDVADPATIHSLADFVRSQFGKLDILLESRSIGLCGTSAIVTGSNDKTTMLIVLGDDKHPSTVKCDIREQAQVNNAAIFGVSVDGDALSGFVKDGEPIKWNEIVTPTYELAEKCLRTNYYGSKRMCEVLIPLLQLSDLPRIVNVSSNMGKLKTVSNEWAKGVFSDVENLTEERVDEVLSQYLNDYKEGSLETKRWPANAAAYILSKAAMNAYTRILAKKHPNFCINCVCPGYVKTDMTNNTGKLTAEEGAETPVRLALLPKGGPSGLFFSQKEETSFD